jgi:alpha-tubulin suppressor-like RCC1 family protein
MIRSALIVCFAALLFAGIAHAGPPQIATRAGSSFAIDTSGRLLAWGDDSAGQLAQGRSLQSLTPQRVGSGYAAQLAGAAKQVIAAGFGHSLAVKADGTLWAWGQNNQGQVGDGSKTDRSGPVPIGSGYSAVAAGYDHSVAVKGDGTLWAWGNNNFGQLGDGTLTARLQPVQVGTGYGAVAAGTGFSVAVKADGSLWAWGSNIYGQLGDGTFASKSSPAQIGGGFVSVSAGAYFALALKTDGSLWAWGQNDMGQLGIVAGQCALCASATPARVGTGYAAVAAGWDHAVGLKADGTLWAWGSNDYGQLGTLTTPVVPIQIGAGYTSVAAGNGHTVALKSDGSLWAWGRNINGQVGDGTTSSRYAPVQIGSGYASIAAGTKFTLAVRTDGSLWSWGIDSYGQLGLGAITARTKPVVIGTGYSAVASGGEEGAFGLSQTHVLAVKADGTLWAWGNNAAGQLGDGTSTSRATPVQIGAGYKAVTAGRKFSLAIKTDGSLWAWGDNLEGQLGDGTIGLGRTRPAQVGIGYGAVAAGGGDFGRFAAGIKLDGTLWVWGDNAWGQLGDGTTDSRPAPVQVGNDYLAVATGSRHAVALKTNGSLWAWGYNTRGQLGDGTSAQRLRPVQIGSGYMAVAARGDQTFALRTDGTLMAWGDNQYGQLGDGTTESRSSPVQVGSGFVAVAAATRYTLALRTDGTLMAWGANAYGQLGTGVFLGALTAQLVINDGVTGILDLDAQALNSIPASAVPSLILEARRLGGLVSLTLGANVYFGAIDLGALASGTFAAGGPYKVWVAALVPSGINAVPAGVYMLDSVRGWSYYAGGPLPEYVSNVTLDQTQHYFISVLEGVDLSGLVGARILVGYGTDDQEMLGARRYREIYVVSTETPQ